jgi:[CysO sulfur-carrier protein]-S-L-cysteine hydrolase
MQILLAPPIVKRLRRELRRAGKREIGGLLMGEHLGSELFRVVDISMQRSGGTRACFIRDPRSHQPYLDKFFARTGNDYSRFNYLGEWHSHPTFEAAPSVTDLETMQSIVSDPAVGVNFLTLLVAKLSRRNVLEATATAFSVGNPPQAVNIAIEVDEKLQARGSLATWLRKILKV